MAVAASAVATTGSISFSLPFASPSIVVGPSSPPCCACFFAITTVSSDLKLAFLLSAAVNVVNNLEPGPVQLVLPSGLALADTRRDAGLLSSESSNALVRFGGGERVVLVRVVAAAGAEWSGFVWRGGDWTLTFVEEEVVVVVFFAGDTADGREAAPAAGGKHIVGAKTMSPSSSSYSARPPSPSLVGS